MIGLLKAIRDAIGKDVGDTVHVTVERDTEERTVTVPVDLAAALRKDPTADAAFEKLSYTHRREFVQWIEEARRPETRERRIGKTVEMVKEGKTR